MKCPYCGTEDSSVTDSRLTNEGDTIRRRRECQKCGRRFTTYERLETLLPLVVKKDGQREAFNRLKILSGIQKACEKRPVPYEKMEEVVQQIERVLQESGEQEIPSSKIGEELMQHLRHLDQVAYVRFASVYRSFKDINEFMSELQTLLKNKR